MIEQWLKRVSYRPGFKFRLFDAHMGYNMIETTYESEDAAHPEHRTTIKLRVQNVVPDLQSEEHFITWFKYDILMKIERHECEEWFRMDGKQVHNPHYQDWGKLAAGN